jgi:hypothetical protein
VDTRYGSEKSVTDDHRRQLIVPYSITKTTSNPRARGAPVRSVCVRNLISILKTPPNHFLELFFGVQKILQEHFIAELLTNNNEISGIIEEF